MILFIKYQKFFQFIAENSMEENGHDKASYEITHHDKYRAS